MLETYEIIFQGKVVRKIKVNDVELKVLANIRLTAQGYKPRAEA